LSDCMRMVCQEEVSLVIHKNRNGY
jgi:hypothetical protein